VKDTREAALALLEATPAILRAILAPLPDDAGRDEFWRTLRD